MYRPRTIGLGKTNGGWKSPASSVGRPQFDKAIHGHSQSSNVVI